MENNTYKRTHRIGSVTCGVALIFFGVLFLLHIAVPVLSYRFIFRLWPCILIMLGIEILIGNFMEKRRKDTADEQPVSFLYDKGAVFLLILLLLFAVGMAIADEWYQYAVTFHENCSYHLW